MINKKIWLGILVMVFGMMVVGCGAGVAKLSGKYVNEHDSTDYVVFKEKNEIVVYGNSMSAAGTYSLKGSDLTMKAVVFGTEAVWEATLSGDKKSFVDTDGDKYIKE